jgi:hypothetical protein
VKLLGPDDVKSGQVVDPFAKGPFEGSGAEAGTIET